MSSAAARFARLGFALMTFALPAAAGMTWLELEAVLPLPDATSPGAGGAGNATRATAVTWVVGMPDTLADTDTRAILASFAPGQGQALLPRGRLARDEEQFLRGLRAFMDGNARAAADMWRGLADRRLPPEIASGLRVNLAVLAALNGGAALSEKAWRAEWAADGPAAEGAWRNLITLRMAQGRWSEAGAAIEAMLKENPRDRLALIAKAALLWQFRPEWEWAAFLKTHASEDSAVADMQLMYGEYLLDRGRLAESVIFFDKALATRPSAGRGWYLLADAQFRQGYYYFALDCLQNAGRAGYAGADFHELYARVLHACCTGDEDPRAAKARAAAQELLEKGLEKDLHRRSAAQLLYTLYAQNMKPDAARALERNLWFHFEGPRRDVAPLGAAAWGDAGLDGRELRVKFGLYDLDWILALRDRDVYRAFD